MVGLTLSLNPKEEVRVKATRVLIILGGICALLVSEGAITSVMGLLDQTVNGVALNAGLEAERDLIRMRKASSNFSSSREWEPLVLGEGG